MIHVYIYRFINCIGGHQFAFLGMTFWHLGIRTLSLWHTTILFQTSVYFYSPRGGSIRIHINHVPSHMMHQTCSSSRHDRHMPWCKKLSHDTWYLIINWDIYFQGSHYCFVSENLLFLTKSTLIHGILSIMGLIRNEQLTSACTLDGRCRLIS